MADPSSRDGIDESIPDAHESTTPPEGTHKDRRKRFSPKTRLVLLSLIMVVAVGTYSFVDLWKIQVFLHLAGPPPEFVQGAGPEWVELSREAMGLWMSNRYDDALVFALKAYALAKDSASPDHVDVATSMSNLALIHYAQERYSEAESLYERALDIRKRSPYPDQNQIAIDSYHLAKLYRKTSRIEEAGELESIAARVDVMKQDSRYKDELTHLKERLYTVSMSEVKEYFPNDMDESHYTQRLEKLIKERGPDDRIVASAQTSLANFYRRRNRHTLAGQFYASALETKKRAYGRPDHSYVIESQVDLAAHYKSQGNYAEAERLFKYALNYYEQKEYSWGDVTVVHNLARLYQAQGQLVELESLYDKILHDIENYDGVIDHRTQGFLSKVAALYEVEDRFWQAEVFYKRVLEVERPGMGGGYYVTVRRLGYLAALHETQGHYTRSLEYYERELALRENWQNPEPSNASWILIRMASIHTKQRHYDTAEPLLKRALEITEQAPNSTDYEIAAGLGNLATLYRAMNRDREAEALEARAADVGAASR